MNTLRLLRWIQIVSGLLLILVPTTSVFTTSNSDLQQVEEDGNVKESQLRKKPLQVKVKEEEGNNNRAASYSLDPLMPILGGVQQDDLNFPSLKEDEDLLEPEQMQMATRNLVKRKREKESEASDAGENKDGGESYEPQEDYDDYPEGEFHYYDFKDHPEYYRDISYDFEEVEVDDDADEEGCTKVGAESSKDKKSRSKQDKQSFSPSSRDVSVIVAFETTLPSLTELSYTYSLLEESIASIGNANTLRAHERDASLAILRDLQSRVVITQDAINNSGSAQDARALDESSK